MEDSLTVAALAGLVAPWLTAILTTTRLRSVYKRLIAISVAVVLVALGLFAIYQPVSWAQVASVIAAAIGVMQVVYTALKPVFDQVEIAVNPGKHARPTPTGEQN